MAKQNNIAALMRSGEQLNMSQKIKIVVSLSVPAILANIVEIIMQYIDSAMVGQLGAGASASIGVVASTTWLIGGWVMACCYGFSVQTAQAIGAQKQDKAKNILRQSIVVCFTISLFLLALTFAISKQLPVWLHADTAIQPDAVSYFRIYCLFLPVRMIYNLMNVMLQSTGNMKTSSLFGGCLCILDILFNALFIYGLHMGVAGAALGTAMSYLVCAVFITWFTCVSSPVLSLKGHGSWKPEKDVLRSALRIGGPMSLQQSALSIAQVVSTRIVSPLGTLAIAANSFAITTEAFCYMPGYGIAQAGTILIGQSIGADRKDLAKSFAWLVTLLTIFLMTALGITMYFLCPYVFAFLTPDTTVQAMGIEALRIELFAEPFFAAAIAVPGVLRGAGDTMVPFLIDLLCMWGIRLTLAYTLSKTYGLNGVWIAMAVELSSRGIIYLIRLKRGRWLNHKSTVEA